MKRKTVGFKIMHAVANALIVCYALCMDCCEGLGLGYAGLVTSGEVRDDKRQPWPNADKKSGPQLLRGPKLLSFGPKLFKY